MKLEERDIIINYLKSKTTYIDECWIFNGLLVDGYGKVKISGKTYGVHQLSAHYFLDFNLSSPLQPNHKQECNNRACWNPDHLYIGTQYQNAQDTRELGNYHNQQKTHCPQGHLMTGKTRGPSTNFRWNRYCKICRSEQKAKYRKRDKDAKG